MLYVANVHDTIVIGARDRYPVVLAIEAGDKAERLGLIHLETA